MSIRKGSRTIASSVPVTEWGSIDGTLADQADIKSALDSKAPSYSPTFTGTPIAPTAPIDVSNNQIATTKYVQDALLASEVTLPEQTGNAGKFLSTNGTIPSWESVDILPSQSGQSGKFLTTNGTSTSWGSVDLSGKRSVISNASRVYTTDNNGNQSEHYYSNTPYNNAIAVFDGSAHLKSSSPSADNDVATKKYVDDNAVKNTGDETIGGTKTFTSSIISNYNDIHPIKIKDENININTTPENNSNKMIIFTDVNDNVVSRVTSSKLTNGDQSLSLYVSTKVEDVLNFGELSITATHSGEIDTKAPTPTSVTDNTSKIATTAWVINVLKALYPVGSLYMGTQNSCPLSAFFGTWTLVSAGNVLWTGNGTSGTGTTANANYANAAANTTIAAGLPNIKDNFYFADTYYGSNFIMDSDSGLIKYTNQKVDIASRNRPDNDGSTTKKQKFTFDASQVNNIFGKSSTVQPPAYVVNVWRRTA